MAVQIDTRSPRRPFTTRQSSAPHMTSYTPTTSPLSPEEARQALVTRLPRGSSAKQRPLGTDELARNTKPEAKRGKGARITSHTDVIDQLDITTGFGAFHHDGPFDAASLHRNKNSARRPAPMAAFDPLSLASATGLPSDSVTSDPYAVARASVAASDTAAQKIRGGQLYQSLPSVPYDSEAANYPPSRTRRDSDTSITLGYPVDDRRHNQKSKAVAQAFGLVDNEAWEDFGRSHYTRQPPRESVTPDDDKMSKNQRAQRAASVWDMEATLRAGKPIAAAPPLPSLPSQYMGERSRTRSKSNPPLLTAGQTGMTRSGSGGLDNGTPKRSKSLMQRLKQARTAANIPIAAATEEEDSPRSLTGKAADVIPPSNAMPYLDPHILAADPNRTYDDDVGVESEDDDFDMKQSPLPSIQGRPVNEAESWTSWASDENASPSKADDLRRKPSLVQKMRGLKTR